MQNKVLYNQAIEKLKAEMLITVEDLSASTLIDLNVDPVKLIPYVVESQRLKLEPLIGTALMSALQDSNRTFEYDYLAQNQITDVLIHWSLESFVSSNKFTISNGGFFHHLPEDGESATNIEINTFIQQERYKAQDFADRLIKFLNTYSKTYPEWSECQAGGIKASQEFHATGGWVMGSYVNDCIDCPEDPNLFTVEFWEGNSTEANMGFDLSTLTNYNTIPNNVWAQPQSTYYWVVCDREVYISQAGGQIPLDPFTNSTPEEAAYVMGQQDSKWWIRVKISEVYETAVNFTVRLK